MKLKTGKGRRPLTSIFQAKIFIVKYLAKFFDYLCLPSTANNLN